MAGGVIAGLLGPQTAKWSVDWLAPVTFAGVYVAMAGFSIAVLALIQVLRIPGLTTAERSTGGRPMRQIASQPAYRVALASSVFGYAVMTLTMSATPLAMLACGFHFVDSATVIQAHIVAMFLPSFFTGHLIARFGVLPMIVAGGLIELGGALTNLAGVELGNFVVSNVLIGTGWNFTFVGGSTLLTSTYAPAERAKVQASHDFTVYAATASAAALSGVLQAKAGWTVINLAALPLMAVIVSAGLWLLVAPATHGHGSRGMTNSIMICAWAIVTTGTKAATAPRAPRTEAALGDHRLGAAGRIGHNQGPPLEEPVADAFVRLALA